MSQKLAEDHTTEPPLLKKMFEIGARFWSTQVQSMRRGGTTPWWTLPLQKSEMTYECDSSLGSPPIVDCTQVEWQQLGAASDSLTLGPGKVTFFHSSEWVVNELCGTFH